jgi:hypothetical protein
MAVWYQREKSSEEHLKFLESNWYQTVEWMYRKKGDFGLCISRVDNQGAGWKEGGDDSRTALSSLTVGQLIQFMDPAKRDGVPCWASLLFKEHRH